MSRLSTRRRVPVRLIAAAVGAVIVLGNGLLVLGPVLQIPAGGITIAVIVGFLVAIACVVLAGIARYPWLSWTFVVSAWVASLIASVWPLIATANAAVDRAGDVIPWIVDLIQQVG